MEAVIFRPLEAFLSFCGIIAEWFIDRGSINFIVIQMAVAILLIALFVMSLVYGRAAILMFKNRR